MEIREFAELILFGDRLEDKLLRAGAFTDERPGVAVKTPTAPGRPKNLLFSDTPGVGKRLSELSRLESEENRGELLHGFANHELLATELMALLLLLFPDAPPEFRRSIMHTLREEQNHFMLYQKRMKTLGYEFGDFPVNDFFWKHVVDMQSPLDFTARMSLTFEQANLDYATFYAQAFGRVGDRSTAAVLGVVLRDEIGHVKNGLEWFQRLQPVEEGELWSAWRKALPENLNPVRARGGGFNESARRAAGLPEAYIREIAVYGRSRGRSPGVYFFNPECDESQQPGPPGGLLELKKDLEGVMLFVAALDDLVYLRRKPGLDFLLELREAGFSLPEIKTFPEQALAPVPTNRKLSGLLPWGWTPELWKNWWPLFVDLKTDRPILPAHAGDGSYPSYLPELFSKAYAQTLAQEFTRKKTSADELEHSPIVLLSDYPELLRLSQEKIAKGEPVLIKGPWSSAGRNRLLFKREIRERDEQSLKGLLERNGQVLLEPFHQRLADFSVQVQIRGPGQIRLLGVTRLITDERGRYLGNMVGKIFSGLSPALIRFLNGTEGRRGALTLMREAALFAAANLAESGYLGPMGTDAYVYKNVSGDFFLRSFCEINPRFTMGRVALGLGAHLRQGGVGVWLHLNLKHIQKAGFENFQDFASFIKEKHPLKYYVNPRKQIEAGALFTTDYNQASKMVTLLLVHKDPELILEFIRETLALPL